MAINDSDDGVADEAARDEAEALQDPAAAGIPAGPNPIGQAERDLPWWARHEDWD